MRFFLLVITLLVSNIFFEGSLLCSYFDNGQAVVVVVPVADGLGRPAQQIAPQMSAQEFYDNLAFSPEQGPDSCPRIHQCLFNESGEVREKTGDEYFVVFPHFYYIADGKKHSGIWMHKNSLRRICDFPKDLPARIPEPLNADKKSTVDSSVVTLAMPWLDNATGQWYSAGTRFLRNSDEDRNEQWAVFLPDYERCETRVVRIAHACGIVNAPRMAEESRKQFVRLLRSWVAQVPGKIPYVWGGCSYIGRCEPRAFRRWEGKRGEQEIVNWQRDDKSGSHSGFDCSGAVLRAALIAGIPYFCKNTSTLGLECKDVPIDEPLAEGDCILFPGHVMVISSLEDNRFIDASSYGKGQACFEESPLDEGFVSVKTFIELRRLIGERTVIERKNRGVAPTKLDWVRLVRICSLQSEDTK